MNERRNAFRPAPLLSEQVFQFLREQIISGQLKEGEKLNELSLQKKFQSSRSPLREALRRLEVEGLVRILPRRGTFVRRILVEDLREAVEVRASLEGLAAHLVIDRITPSRLKTLARLLDQMDLSEGNVRLYTRIHHCFHRTFVEASGNRTLVRLHGIVTEPFVSDYLTYVYFEHSESFFKETGHRQIYEALRSGDAVRLRDLVERHIMTVLESMVPCLNLYEDSAGGGSSTDPRSGR